MASYVIGVDGGNSKTDIVLATTTGRLLARRRGAGVPSPLRDVENWRRTLLCVIGEAQRDAGRAACAVYCLANIDLPVERRIAERELRRAGIAAQSIVQNDAHAVLRAGATRPWGVAVVAGAGVNAVGVHPSGRVAGFLGLGDYTGDVGGGHDIGVNGLGAAIRAGDGRGPATILATSVPLHFGLRKAATVATAVHRGAIRYDDLHVLAPVVFAAAAADDPVALRIVSAFADEVVAMAVALIRRLRLTRTDVEVVLGGGILQNPSARLVERIRAGIIAAAPLATVTVLDVPPVFGAVAEALCRAGAKDAALRRIRRSLT